MLIVSVVISVASRGEAACNAFHGAIQHILLAMSFREAEWHPSRLRLGRMEQYPDRCGRFPKARGS